MLANAWFSHAYFKLSFGRQDKIAQQLDALALVVEDPIIQFKDSDKTLLRQATRYPLPLRRCNPWEPWLNWRGGVKWPVIWPTGLIAWAIAKVGPRRRTPS